MKKLQPHPIAEIFPQMDDDQFAALKADIEANGLELPGLLHEGKILDGRNRYRACLELGIEMRWQDTSGWELTSEDSKPFAPIQYVLSHNLHRRHLTPSQRAMVAARIANLKEGRPSKETSQNCGVSKREDAAKLLNVSSRSIDAAKRVIEGGAPELIEAVENETIKVSLAEKLTKAADKKHQAELVKQGPKAVREFLSPSIEHKPESIEEPAPMPARSLHVQAALEAFRCDRLNCLRAIFDDLQPQEVAVLSEWIAMES